MYNKCVTLSNGSTFKAKEVYLWESTGHSDNSRIDIVVDDKDLSYDTIMSYIKDGDISYVEVTEYKSIKVKGEYTTGDMLGTTRYEDYGVNYNIIYNSSTNEYTIELYKITDLVKANRAQRDRIMDTSIGILDTFEYTMKGE